MDKRMTLGGHYAASHAHKHLNLSISTPATYFLTKLSNQNPANINITSCTLKSYADNIICAQIYSQFGWGGSL